MLILYIINLIFLLLMDLINLPNLNILNQYAHFNIIRYHNFNNVIAYFLSVFQTFNDYLIICILDIVILSI